MTPATLFEEIENTPATHAQGNGHTLDSAADALGVSFTACTLSFSPWWPNSKGLTKDQKKEAARIFGAEKIKGGSFPLCPEDHEAIKRLVAIRNATRAYWVEHSLPYPQAGLRLIKRSELPWIRQRLDDFAAQLPEAIAAMDDARYDFMDWARDHNGGLFLAADYPATWHECYAIGYGFPTVTPPDYLRQLDPEAYERERVKAAAKLDEAVALAESEFIGKLAELVEQTMEKMAGRADGKPKVFRDSAVENWRDFFHRFQSLNVHSSAQLDALVSRAHDVLGDASAQAIRDNDALRRNVLDTMAQMQGTIDGLLVDRPRRAITRRRPTDQTDD